MMIAVTGGFGSGKSTLGAAFARAGWRVRDLDAEVRGLYADPASGVSAALRARWGGAVFGPDGAPDRRAVGAIVFRDPGELAFLNGMIHPLLRNGIAGLRRTAQTFPTAVEVPLLFELGWEELFDATAAVWAPRALRRERLRNRGFDPEEFARREAAQLDPDRKLERADYGIVNSGDPALLEAQCEQLIQQLMGKL